MQDIEFTIEDGKLYMLQTRNGKRTGQWPRSASPSKWSTRADRLEEAVMRNPADQLDQLLRPSSIPPQERDVVAKGLPAGPGAASGSIVFSADAPSAAQAGEKVMLVRVETSPEDLAA
jgi:pyruvate,orthophosphate dikinase